MEGERSALVHLEEHILFKLVIAARFLTPGAKLLMHPLAAKMLVEVECLEKQKLAAVSTLNKQINPRSQSSMHGQNISLEG